MASVRYLVHDVPASIAFYVDQLGFTLRQQFGPAMAILAHGDLTLWLAGPMASAAKPMPDGRSPAPGGWARFVLEVDDLPGLVARPGRPAARGRRGVSQRHPRWPRRPADSGRGPLG